MFLTEAPKPPDEPAAERKPDKVLEWRREVLERAGYDPPGARLLARRRSIDLHLAVDLLKQGCDVNLAMKILL